MQNVDANLRTLIEKADRSGGVGAAVQLLTAELDMLEKLRGELDSKIEHLSYAMDILSKVLVGRQHTAIVDKADDAEYQYRTTVHYKKSKRVNRTAEVLARSKLVLLAEGRPLGRTELLEKITESGFIINTADPAKFIGRTLWESPDFYHIKNEGYWLTEHKSNLENK